LMASIGEQGYSAAEPLLVTEKNAEGKYRVIEGNRRLCALKLLREPTLVAAKSASLKKVALEAKQRPDEVPCIVYRSREDVLAYLGYRHITGIKQWDSLAKARYLRQLYQKSEEATEEGKCRELAGIIGSRSDYVRKLLCGLAVYDKIQEEGFFNIPDLERNISFSLITTALSYTELRSFAGLASGGEVHPQSLEVGHLKEFTEWLFKTTEGKTRLGESRNLGQLAAVVADKEALREFRDGKGLETAFLLSGGAKDRVQKAIWNASEKLDLAYKYSAGVVLEERELEQLKGLIVVIKALIKLTTPEEDG